LNLVPYKYGARLAGSRIVAVTRMRRNPIMSPKDYGIEDVINVDAFSAAPSVVLDDHAVELHLARKEPLKDLLLRLSPPTVILLVRALPFHNQLVEVLTIWRPGDFAPLQLCRRRRERRVGVVVPD
jgi:hypothetical protein